MASLLPDLQYCRTYVESRTRNIPEEAAVKFGTLRGPS